MNKTLVDLPQNVFPHAEEKPSVFADYKHAANIAAGWLFWALIGWMFWALVAYTIYEMIKVALEAQ